MQQNLQILVHCCCGPCASSAVERLLSMGYNPTLLYGNSQIYPLEENQKRFEHLVTVSEFFKVPLMRSLYDHQSYLTAIAGNEHEKEGGARCKLCINFNLAQTAKVASEHSIPYCTTTLTISPHKHSPTIFSLGEAYSSFVPIDFKKRGGFMRSIELSEQLQLYRQRYCGCEFSCT